MIGQTGLIPTGFAVSNDSEVFHFGRKLAGRYTNTAGNRLDICSEPTEFSVLENQAHQNPHMDHRTPRWWQWASALSLEAPIVAVAWQLTLAHLHGVRLFPSVVAILGLTVWWIYVLDRSLDALRAESPED